MSMSPRLLRPRASGFSPLSISGCIGWYDSADTTAIAQNTDGTGAVTAGTQVGYWKDKSSLGAHLTQGTAANRPTLTASSVNGFTALVFDGTNDTLARSTGYTAQNSLSGLTRILVGSSSQTCISAGTAGAGASHSFQLFNNRVYTYSAATPVNVQVDAVNSGSGLPLRIYASVFNGAATSLSVLFNNVTQTAVGTAGTVGATTASGGVGLWLGSNSGLNNFHAGPIAEYIVFNKALSTSEMLALHRWIAKKWGFTL